MFSSRVRWEKENVGTQTGRFAIVNVIIIISFVKTGEKLIKKMSLTWPRGSHLELTFIAILLQTIFTDFFFFQFLWERDMMWCAVRQTPTTAHKRRRAGFVVKASLP